MKLSTVRCGILGFAFFALGALAQASEPTAFDLIKEGNRYVGEDSKDKVVTIRSEKSVGTLTPNIWYVVYYDADATFKATEVKFGGGKKMTVKRPMRMLEPITGDNKKMDMKLFKTDSDSALDIAKKEPLLANLSLKSTQFWLERVDGEPAWKVRFWAAKVSNTNKIVDIGDVYVSTAEGKVIKNDLHPEKAD
ncbi:MAG: hypothetical protein JWM68_5223 [Verrucomicrobiales bacterium]|nr:hypothetical protein [Verrucomicrobiales bacterium]